MIRRQLFERVPISRARGKNLRCQWLDEMTEGTDGPFVRSRLVAMDVALDNALIHSHAQRHSNA